MDHSILINLIGFAAAVISFVLWLPQARTTWRNRNNRQILAAISTGTQWLVICNASLWGAYAVLTNAFWTGAPGLVNLPLAVGTLVILRRGRRHPPIEHCELWPAEHVRFTTDPAGYGSVFPCSGIRVRGSVCVPREDVAGVRAATGSRWSTAAARTPTATESRTD